MKKIPKNNPLKYKSDKDRIETLENKVNELIDKVSTTTNEQPKFKYSFEGKKDIKFLYKLLSNVKPTSLKKVEKEQLESLLDNIAFELEG